MALIKANGHYVLHVDDSQNDQHSPIHHKYSYKNSPFKSPRRTSPSQEPPYTLKTRLIIRILVFMLGIVLLFLARYNVPDNDVSCVVDKAMDLFQGVNDWILANHFWRNTLQIICSLFMDAMFLSLGAYWIYRGESSRLVVSVGIFYLVRAIVQGVWFSPYTKGFWWYDPGFPSIVVPYGRGSDFFFSGHIGFVTICALEWRKYGNRLMVYILAVGGVYTAFILLAYQVHYSIDLFVGVVVAHYVFIMVDHYKDSIDGFFVLVYVKGARVVGKWADRQRKMEV